VWLVVAWLTLFGTACPRQIVLPDPAFPHQVAEPVESVTVWCGLPDGKLAKCEVRLDKGWWIASPEALKLEGVGGGR
jgi:hypothetical protein